MQLQVRGWHLEQGQRLICVRLKCLCNLEERLAGICNRCILQRRLKFEVESLWEEANRSGLHLESRLAKRYYWDPEPVLGH